MAGNYFVVQNGLQVGPLTIDASTGTINTSGNVNITGNLGVSSISKDDSSVTINDTGAGNSDITFNINGQTEHTMTNALATLNSNVTIVGNLIVSNIGYVQVPAGTTTQRPATPALGMIRYNSTISSFEGYGAGPAWASLGGVKSVDGFATITAESSAGAGDDVLRFYSGSTGSSVQVAWASAGNVSILPSTTSTSTLTGALQVTGGAGIQGALFVGGIISAPTIGNASSTHTGGTGNFTTVTTLTQNATTGNITNIGSSNIIATVGSVGTLIATTGFSTPNLIATSGSVGTLIATTGFSSGNVVISGGSANGLTTLAATTAVATNLSTSNLLATSGSVGTLIATTGFSSGNVVMTSGASASTLVATNFSTANAQITGGTVNFTTAGATTGNFGTITTATLNTNNGNITNAGHTTMVSTNMSSSNLIATSGSIGTLVTTTGFSGSNVRVTGGTDSTGTQTGAFQVTGGAGISGNLWVGGNLYVSNIYSVTTNTLTVNDPLVYFVSSVTPYNFDIGFYSDFVGGPVNAYQHTGVVRQQSANAWVFFSNVQSEPTTTNINWADAGIIYDTVKMGAVILANTTGTNLSGTTGLLTNFSTSNLIATSGSVGTLIATTGFSSGNVVMTSGASASTLVATNFSTANAQITGGAVNSLTTLGATTGVVTNFSSGNLIATSGSVGTLIATTGFSTANAVITNLGGTTAVYTNLSSGNLQSSGAHIPTANATIALGGASNYWSTLYSATATHNQLTVAGQGISSAGNVAVTSTIYGQGLYDNSNRVLSTTTGAGNLAISGTQVTLSATGPGAASVGSGSAIPVITTDAYGRIIATSTAALTAVTNLSSTGAGNISVSAATGSSSITLPATGPGAASVGSSTAIPVITTDAYGRVASTTTAAVVAPAGTLTGATLASGVTASSLTSVGTLATLTVTATITGSVSGSAGSATGNAGTATTLQTARAINGVSFNGSADITVTAAAGTLSGATLASGVTASSLTSVGTLTGLTVSGAVAPSTNNTINLGGVSNYWATIYGTSFVGVSTTAKYADLAENYQADKTYSTGTVLMFGGTEEVTVATADTTRVAGVVSTNPAHLMNSELQGVHVVPLALTGRVPCNVIGPVQKGDIMVSAGFGYAKVNNTPQIGTIIGKALQDFPMATKGMIEVVVGRF